MRRLNDTNATCLAQLRVLLSRAIKQRYVSFFHCAPPFRFTRICDFTFLPHILSCPKATGDILLKDITDWAMPQVAPGYLAECLDQLTNDDYYHSATLIIDLEEQCPNDVLPRENRLIDMVQILAEHLYNFRAENQKTQPTYLKYISTWNVGGWTPPRARGDEKIKQFGQVYARGLSCYRKPIGLVSNRRNSSRNCLASKLHRLRPPSRIRILAVEWPFSCPSATVYSNKKSLLAEFLPPLYS